MKHLVILAPLLLAGCVGGNSSGTLIDLKDDPNSGCGAVNYLGSAGGFVGHLGTGRPNDSLEMSLTGCKITPVLPPAPPTMLVAPGTQAPSVISLTPPPVVAPVGPVVVAPVK